MNYQEALKYTMNLCSKSERCNSEVRARLKGYGVKEPEIINILAELEKQGFVDESRYAAMFASDKLRLNKWGNIKIRFNLAQKGIPPEKIEEALSTLDPIEYEEVLRQEIAKKRKTLKGDNKWDLRAKLLRFAGQRGFESELIYSVLDAELG